jgi:hypothetical protein
MIDAIPWILISIAALIVVLGVAAIVAVKKKGKHHETDYKTFFTMGIIWIIIFGGYSIARGELTMSALFGLGMVFFIMGAANRNKWKNAKPLTHNQKIGWYAMIVVVLALGVGMYIFLP